MNVNLPKIVEVLNDNQYHDGTSIGNQFSITRAAVWKIIKKLEQYGIPIKSVKGKGYMLEEPLILLDSKKIKASLKGKPIHLDVLEKTESTMEYVKKLPDQDKKTHICIAETQTQGRSRLDRQWHSPFGQNIYLSLSYPFQKDISELSGLSLVVGLAVCKAIETICHLPEPLSLKWPNDIIANHKKISGILIEIQTESHGFCNVIIGVGINVNMQRANKTQINQHWTSVQKLTGQYQDRNGLCAELIDQLLVYLKRFNTSGLNDFLQEWKNKDCLYNQPVRLSSNKTTFSGTGAGINEQGHLILALPKNVKQAFSSGDTTLLK